MDPQFKKAESLAAGTQRILEMQLVAALEYLKFPPERRDEGIHECRKCLKYARALLRLVEAGMPRRAFRKWNTTLRDAARCVSALRDETAVLECLDALAAESCPAGTDAMAFSTCREALARPDTGTPAAAEAAAEKAFLLISGLLTTPHDPALGRGREARIVREGLRNSHALGRRAMARTRRKRDIESVHEWRKRAKDLRYQVAMLRPVWPALCDVLEGELNRLTDSLGHIHDLHLIGTALDALPSGAVSEGALSLVRTRADRSSEKAVSDALRLGARLYGDKPGGFADRIAGWWALWRQEETERDGKGARHE